MIDLLLGLQAVVFLFGPIVGVALTLGVICRWVFLKKREPSVKLIRQKGLIAVLIIGLCLCIGLPIGRVVSDRYSEYRSERQSKDADRLDAEALQKLDYQLFGIRGQSALYARVEYANGADITDKPLISFEYKWSEDDKGQLTIVEYPATGAVITDTNCPEEPFYRVKNPCRITGRTNDLANIVKVDMPDESQYYADHQGTRVKISFSDGSRFTDQDITQIFNDLVPLPKEKVTLDKDYRSF